MKARKIVSDIFQPLQSITSDIDTVQKNVLRIETLQTRILHAVSQKDVEKEKEELNDLNGKKLTQFKKSASKTLNINFKIGNIEDHVRKL